MDEPLEVRFKADGSGLFGLYGAKIEGEADIQVTKLDAFKQGEHAALRNIQTKVPAKVRIAGMTFSDPFHIDPVPSKLDLVVDPGLVSFEAFNRSGFRANEWVPDEDTWAPGSQVTFGVYPATISDGWHFLKQPFRAAFGRDGSGKVQGLTVHSWIEINVEHTPG